ncbi:hypothetical protein C2G38_2082102, partial [Gigaspora rosea]
MATCKMFLSVSAFNLYVFSCIHVQYIFFSLLFPCLSFFSTDYVHVQNIILALHQFVNLMFLFAIIFFSFVLLKLDF